jgi:hypothetical protein
VAAVLKPRAGVRPAIVDPCRQQRMAIDPDQGALAPSPAMMQPITPDTLRYDMPTRFAPIAAHRGEIA